MIKKKNQKSVNKINRNILGACLLALFFTFGLYAEETVLIKVTKENGSPIRSNMSKSSWVLGNLAFGKEIMAIDMGEWYKILAPGCVDSDGNLKYGYVAKQDAVVCEESANSEETGLVPTPVPSPNPEQTGGTSVNPRERELRLHAPNTVEASRTDASNENYLLKYPRLGEKYYSIIAKIDNNFLSDLQEDIESFKAAVDQYPNINQVKYKNDLLTLYNYLADACQRNLKLIKLIEEKNKYKNQLIDIYNKCLEVYRSERATVLNNSFVASFKKYFYQNTKMLEKIESMEQLTKE